MESLVSVVTVQDGFCYFSLAFGECGYSIIQLNLISHYQFSQEVFWEEKKGVFSQVGLQNAFLFLHYEYAVFCHTCLMGFKLKRMKTSMRADRAFVSSIAS